MITTLALCRKNGACEEGYRKLAKHLGGVRAYGKDTPIDLLTVLESNGLEDCIWALRAVPKELEAERDRIARTFACDCAGRVLPNFEKEFPYDGRPRKAIEVARRFIDGNATAEELSAAYSAAWSAARSAAESAARSAESAAESAARSAYSAAWSAAESAAERKWQAERLRELLS